MNKLTKFNTRKIVYLILLLVEIGAIIGATFAVNPSINVFLWQMIVMSSKIGIDTSVGAYIIGCLSCIIIITLLVCIPSILRKRDSSYLNALGAICVLITICLIINTICKSLGTLSIVFIAIALAFNIISSIYCFLCIKFNNKNFQDNKEEVTNNGKN